MQRLSVLLILLLAAIALPKTAVAQEDSSPPTLRLSFYMCDSSQLGDVLAEVESQNIPVWDELVDEGMVQSFGYFVHSWASEWNLGVYTLAESIDAVVKASEEAGRRLDELYGEAPDLMSEACPHHRDGFYVIGPSTGEDEEEEEQGGS
jgi:hypothetical protein